MLDDLFGVIRAGDELLVSHLVELLREDTPLEQLRSAIDDILHQNKEL